MGGGLSEETGAEGDEGCVALVRGEYRRKQGLGRTRTCGECGVVRDLAVFPQQ